MRTIGRLLAIAVLIGSTSLWAAGGDLPGSGTEGDPYLIEDLADFDEFADSANAATYWASGVYTRLACDPNMAGRLYTTAVIAPETNSPLQGFDGVPFEGVFDGGGHVMSNLTIDTAGATENYLGLFGYIEGSSAEVKDLGMENINISGGRYLGSLCGYNFYGTISNCYSEGSVSGRSFLGGLCGYNREGTITNCYSGGSVTGDDHLGGLCAYNQEGTITNCYSGCSVTGDDWLGGLCGRNSYGPITNCYSGGSVTGDYHLGGLCGTNYGGPITNCYSGGSVTGGWDVGGLCGRNYYGSITNCSSGGSVSGGDDSQNLGGLCGANAYGSISTCYSGGSVTGADSSLSVGGLCGYNWEGTITDCYSGGSVSRGSYLGGLCGHNYDGTLSNCYATGSVTGGYDVGGLCGRTYLGMISTCFWDIDTSGMTDGVGNQDPDPAGATGKTTEQMQTLSTFVDAGWDFITSIWAIDEGVDYPHLWWAFVPILHTEPEITLGTNNAISWEPIAGAIEYYLECAEDPEFTSIVSDSDWIVETSCEFIDLQLGQQYWYRVKAINAAGVETGWSNVEFSLQSTLGDAVDVLLDPASLKNENMKNALLNKIDAAMAMVEEGNYTGALSKLEHDILAKTNGCAETGEPDKNDWILTCEQQSRVYGLVMETIEYVRSLIE